MTILQQRQLDVERARMKPFSPEVRAAYFSTIPVWTAGEDSPGETLLEALQLEWQVRYAEPMPELPEPYDLEGGDLMYVFGGERYVVVGAGQRPYLEIREKGTLYILYDSGGRVVSSENCRDDTEASIWAGELMATRGLAYIELRRKPPGFNPGDQGPYPLVMKVGDQ